MIARVTAVLPVWGWILGVAIGFVAFANLGDDVRQTTGWPVEQATVVSSTETLEGDGHTCGRRAGRYPSRDLVWESSNPPDTLPAGFSTPDVCDQRATGSTDRIVRVVEHDGGVHVYVDPTRSYADAAWLSLTFTGLAWFGLALILWLERLRDSWK